MSRKSDNAIVQTPVFSLDKKLLEAKIKAIEKSLEPLINQITTPDERISANLRKGQSLSAHSLVKILIDTTENFLKNSCEIAQEFPEIRNDLTNEIDNVRSKGNRMAELSREFAYDPISSQKRVQMARAARELLSSVARVLAVADMIDLHKSSRLVETILKSLNTMKFSTTQEDLLANFKTYGQTLKDFSNYVSKTINDIKDADMKAELAGARAILMNQSLFLYTSSKSYLKHPKNESSKALKEQVYNETFSLIEKINNIVKNYASSQRLSQLQQPQRTHSLLGSLDEINKQIKNLTPAKYHESKLRNYLERQFEETVKNLANLSSQSSLIDSNRKNRIFDECNELRKALQDLFSSYENSKNNNSESLLSQIEKNENEFINRSKSIRRQLGKTLAQYLILDTNEPIDNLINAAMSGDENNLYNQIDLFQDYANKLLEASTIACSLSDDQLGIQMVEMSIKQIRVLIPQVICSAKLLCSFPLSKEAQQNMLAFKNAWLNDIRVLLLAVDDIMPINDFLAVCENHLIEHINNCVIALRNQNHSEFVNSSSQITSRLLRVCDLVNAEMNNYEECEFTQRVIGSVSVLRNNVNINFARSVEYASDALKSKPLRDPNENDFIDASRLIYDGFRDIRHALLLMSKDDSDSYSDIGDDDDDNVNETGNQVNPSRHDETDAETEQEPKTPIDTINLTIEQKEQLDKQLDSFNKEKNNFDREVLKWDDKSNDIVVLAKQMCMIIMDMTEFMRGRGPLKTTTDIINSAKKISIIGTSLEKLAKELADECPESQSKRELLGYLGQLPLFCNQLNIASRVKESVLDPDTASSLIIASKNLMTAVSSVVKSSYVASTKYTSKTDNKKPKFQWRMKPPEKKPLVNVSKSNDAPTLIRKGSQKKKIEPVKILSEFQI